MYVQLKFIVELHDPAIFDSFLHIWTISMECFAENDLHVNILPMPLYHIFRERTFFLIFVVEYVKNKDFAV